MNSLRLSVEQYKKGIEHGDRIMLARAITLVESTLPADQQLAGELLHDLLPSTGKSMRVGITGAPGVGKSTFIEAFGTALLDAGRKVAVLTIDPSSQLTRGSILGDKTRMPQLSRHPDAFIRPSPSGITLGGVGAHTRETILLCEAAGFDFIIVETVGTGQSEIAVRGMVDFFLLLVQPGAGDELQGIKKGIVEMADGIAITKADGANTGPAKTSQADFQHALHLQRPQRGGWTRKILTCSAVERVGLAEIMQMIESFKEQLSAAGLFEENRRRQRAAWLREYFQYLLTVDHERFPQVRKAEDRLRALVTAGEISPRQAAGELLKAYHHAVKESAG